MTLYFVVNLWFGLFFFYWFRCLFNGKRHKIENGWFNLFNYCLQRLFWSDLYGLSLFNHFFTLRWARIAWLVTRLIAWLIAWLIAHWDALRHAAFIAIIAGLMYPTVIAICRLTTWVAFTFVLIIFTWAARLATRTTWAFLLIFFRWFTVFFFKALLNLLNFWVLLSCFSWVKRIFKLTLGIFAWRIRVLSLSKRLWTWQIIFLH